MNGSLLAAALAEVMVHRDMIGDGPIRNPRGIFAKPRARKARDNKTLRRFRVATASGRSWKVVRGVAP